MINGHHRLVVTFNGTRIWLAVYAHDVSEPLAVIELSPEQAVYLIHELAEPAAVLLRRALNGRIGVQRGLP